MQVGKFTQRRVFFGKSGLSLLRGHIINTIKGKSTTFAHKKYLFINIVSPFAQDRHQAGINRVGQIVDFLWSDGCSHILYSGPQVIFG